MKSATTTTKTKGARSWVGSMQKHSYREMCLHDYYDGATDVTNSAFCSNRVTSGRLKATSKQKHCHFVNQSIKITSHVVHSQTELNREKMKNSVYFAARSKAPLG